MFHHHCKYIVKLYNHGLSDWGNNSRISTLSWNEFEINLTTPDHNFTSLDPNSNNFSRATKAPSTSNASNSVTNGHDFAKSMQYGMNLEMLEHLVKHIQQHIQ